MNIKILINRFSFLSLLGATVIFLSASSNASAQVCDDPDRDGFGWNGSQTCGVCIDVGYGDGSGWNRFTRSRCQLADNCVDDRNGDQWGFDEVNRRSCRLLPHQVHGATSSNTTNSSDTAPNRCEDRGDGGGFGWNPALNQSCRLEPVVTVQNRCEDRGDGGGWGWNPALNQSCRLDGSAVSSSSERPSTNAAQTASGTPTFNQDRVSSHLFYQQDCIRRSGNTIRHTWAEIPYRDYIIQHNVWNDGAMVVNGVDNRGRISLCTELNGSTTNPKPRWYYNFLNEWEGQPTQVKAYPQVFYGRKIGAFNDSGTVHELGVPARINVLDDFHVEYEFSERSVGERNVAIESFFHNDCTITHANQSQQFEMMVWVGRPTKRTGGTNKVGEAFIDGTTWEVYINTHLNWRYLAYVRKTEAKEGVIDWNAFIDYTRNEAYKLDSRVPRLGSSECMNGIEMGTEIFFGSGDFSLDKFNVIRYQ